jgi:flagella basal body P-ring formation protein FlgA
MNGAYRMTTKFRRLALIAAALPGAAMAATVQDVSVLENRLVAALGAEVGQPGGPAAPIDRRLKLAACPRPVTIDAPALGAVALRCEPLGWRIRVPLLRSFAPMAVAKAAPVVRKGDPVELVAETDSFSVSAQAIAQEDGAPGERIRVKTDPKATPIYAQVVDMGLVRVAAFK